MSIEPHESPFPGHSYPQTLPLVTRRERGNPAPWAHLDSQAWAALTVDDIVDRLSVNIVRSEIDMPRVNDELEYFQEHQTQVIRKSAVLVCLIQDDDGVHILFTRRAAHLKNHRHEVAFPGGRCEEDETPVETALREAHEEVGLLPATVEIVGHLTPIVTMASQSAIWPVVGVLRSKPEFTIDANEVDRVFTVRVADLLDVESFAEERWWRDSRRPTSEDGSFPIFFYRVPDDLIWGATARILTELLENISGIVNSGN